MPDLDQRLAPFFNRLMKNARHRERWARREGLDCYRLYDREIGEAPLALDRYGAHLHLQLYRSRWQADAATQAAWQQHLCAGICERLGVAPTQLHLKTRERQRGRAQYQARETAGEWFTVREQGRRFWINLDRYLDSGLFLDHRPTRARVATLAAKLGNGGRLLNLFCYTGSFTVYAATAGIGESLSVDLSRTYLDWAGRNLTLNGVAGPAHRLLQADVFQYLEQAGRERQRFDLIVLDPPSFSNSKRMRGVLDTQRDHVRLLQAAMPLLSTHGTLFFSTNKRGFRLDAQLGRHYRIEDLSRATLPPDFRDPQTHHCWTLQHDPAHAGGPPVSAPAASADDPWQRARRRHTPAQ